MLISAGLPKEGPHGLLQDSAVTTTALSTQGLPGKEVAPQGGWEHASRTFRPRFYACLRTTGLFSNFGFSFTIISK